jgi:probable phosphoglycerate mutase
VTTTTVFFVRHVPHSLQDQMQVGRMDGITLGEDAPPRLARLAERFKLENLAAVYASPIHRTQVTAHAIADPKGLEVQTRDGLIEIDAGEWEGKTFEEMQADPRHHPWNTARSVNRIPGGETMLEMQVRMISVVEEARRAHPGEKVLLVSHGDPIKAALLYLVGLPIDSYDKITVDPASISTVAVGDWGSKLIRLNEAA